MSVLPESASHGQQVMAAHNDRKAIAMLGVDGVRLIANVNDSRSIPQPAAQSKGKQDVLINIAQPFSNKSAEETDVTKDRLRLDHLRFDAALGQSAKHHRGKSLHALLLIGRV